MQYTGHRVRQLRISSQDEVSISADINALQDAINIASMSGLPPNGLLLVKKLDLGTYRTRSNSQVISRLIDEKLRSEHYYRFGAHHSEHMQQNLVWFSDVTEAAITLLKRVLSRQTTSAWYWRALFPSLSVSTDVTEVLSVVCHDLPRNESKPLLLARLTQHLVFYENVNDLLKLIGLPLVQVMMRESGLHPDPDYSTETKNTTAIQFHNIHLPEIPQVWLRTIRKAIQVFEKDDLRIYWLSYCALVTVNPVLIEGQSLRASVVALTEKIWREAVWEKPGLFKEPAEKARHIEEKSGQKEGISENLAANKIIENKAVAGNGRESIAWVVREGSKTFELKKSSGQKKNKVETFAEEGAMEMPKLAGTALTKRKVLEDDNSSIARLEKSINAEFETMELVDSDYCGFGFLVSLLELLSIGELLQTNQFLGEINFPVRIMRLVAKRIGIHPQHPLLEALPETSEISDQPIENFIVPSAWQSLLKPTEQIDWPISISELEIVVQLLLSRFLYRYAKISLRSLLIRDGQFSVTPAHLDFTFDINHLDIRIRKSGLDLNPGWVCWLGMVVQFHYRTKE